jgi:hypothetical protein
LVSNDAQFTSDRKKTRSGINYPKLVQSYKKIILKFQTTNPARFDEVIQFYDDIIFDTGIRETLGRDNNSEKSHSSASEIDFESDLAENDGEQYIQVSCLINFNPR